MYTSTCKDCGRVMNNNVIQTHRCVDDVPTTDFRINNWTHVGWVIFVGVVVYFLIYWFWR